MTQDTELHRTKASVVAVGLVVALVVTACGDAKEPVEEWEAVWNSTASAVAEASTTDPDLGECQDLLGYLRMQRAVLAPVPLDDLEEPIDSWFTEAEGIFFECDLRGDAAQSSLVTLEALEGEVAVVLEVEQ